jgi:phosphoglycerate kinase
MAKLLTLKDLDYKNRRVFLRVDYNVVEKGKVTDEFRVRQSLPTIQQLLSNGCSLVLASHNGRPEGRVVKELSLRPVAQLLANILKTKVSFVDDCIGKESAEEAIGLKPGGVLLLENLRFHEAEEKNNAAFARALASMAEVYVDDAFANAHRAHASMVGVPKYLPHAAGLLMEREYDMISHLMNLPRRPYMAIIGGVKISSKIEVLENLIKKVDILFIGGAMANTFLQAMGYKIGDSITEDEYVGTAKDLISLAHKNGVDLILPSDVVVAKKPQNGIKHHTVGVSKIQNGDMALDIGKETMKKLIPKIKTAKTIFWNGTLGIAEIPDFSWASRDLAHLMALRKSKAETIIGGGDTAGFIEKLGMHDKYRFVSTGGGASLEMLAGKTLPAIEILKH